MKIQRSSDLSIQIHSGLSCEFSILVSKQPPPPPFFWGGSKQIKKVFEKRQKINLWMFITSLYTDMWNLHKIKKGKRQGAKIYSLFYCLFYFVAIGVIHSGSTSCSWLEVQHLTIDFILFLIYMLTYTHVHTPTNPHLHSHTNTHTNTLSSLWSI